MDYRLLGPLEIEQNGELLQLGGAKPRALLALLLSARGQALPVEAVADELWAGNPPPSAASTLQAYVSRLRRVLPEGVLVTESGRRYVLRPDGPVDRDQFEAEIELGREARTSGDEARASACFERAICLWRDYALPELADSQRGRAESARLDELRRSAEEERFEAELALGHHHGILAGLESAVAAEPMRERRWGQLMLALYRSGRQSDALARYQALRGLLAEELGLDPSPELGRLEQSILMQDPSLELPGPAPVLAASRARPLPTPVTSFIGRRSEQAELHGAVTANRLVTVVGPGGVGKTRLALELVRAQTREDPAGLTAFVELASLSDGSLIVPAIAASLGLGEGGGEELEDKLVNALTAQASLIVIDNCEHVLDHAAQVIDRLLRGAGDLRVIATSREPLGVLGEAVWRVGPLGDDEAVQLLRERASQAGEDANDDTLRQICARLDGLPLAVELAAARLRSVPAEQLLAALGDRSGILGPGPRSGPERQRSLRSLVEWSHDLLEPSDQQLLRRLSAFSGPFDAAAAEAVGGLALGDGVRRLATLVDKSLVELAPGNRYRLLETIREFGQQRLRELGEFDSVCESHLAWFHALGQELAPQFHGAGLFDALRRAEADYDNIRAAIEVGVAEPDSAERALDLTLAMFRFWVVRGLLTEGRQFFDAALNAAQKPTLTRAWALQRAGALAESHGDFTKARAFQTESLELARRLADSDLEAQALNEIALIHRAEGDATTAVRIGRDALAVALREGSTDLTQATCLVNLASSLLEGGRQREARSLYEDAVEILRRTGDEVALGIVLQNLGVAALQAGDSEAALRYTSEGARIADQLGNKQGRATALDMLAQIELERGNIEAAQRAHAEGIAVLRELGNPVFVSISLGTQIEIGLAGGGEPGDAIAEKLELDRRIGFTPGEATVLAQKARWLRSRGETSAALEAGTEAVTIGRRSGNGAVLGEALLELGQLELEAGDTDAAIERFEEAVGIWRDLGHETRLERASAKLTEARGAARIPSRDPGSPTGPDAS